MPKVAILQGKTLRDYEGYDNREKFINNISSWGEVTEEEKKALLKLCEKKTYGVGSYGEDWILIEQLDYSLFPKTIQEALLLVAQEKEKEDQEKERKKKLLEGKKKKLEERNRKKEAKRMEELKKAAEEYLRLQGKIQ